MIGVRNALSAGPTAPPFHWAPRSCGMVLAVVALCATGVFGASLTHLTATPRLYGDPQQVSFMPPNAALLTSLEHNPAVTAITEGVGAGGFDVGGKFVGSIAGTSVKGPLLLTVAGTTLVGDDQIGLGVSTMHQLGVVRSGRSWTSLSPRVGCAHTESYRVVSQISFPQYGGFVSLGTGMLLTMARPHPPPPARGPQLAGSSLPGTTSAPVGSG